MRVVLLVLAAGCGRIGFDADPRGDAARPCTTWGPFGAPARLDAALQTTGDEWDASEVAGGTDIIFYAFRTGTMGAAIWESRRASPTDAFPAATVLVDTADNDVEPALTEDGLTMISARLTSTAPGDLLESHRAALGQPFTGFAPLALDTAADEEGPWLSADGLRLVFASSRGATGMLDLYETTRASLAAPFAAPRELAEIDSTVDEASASLSADALDIYFSSLRSGGPGGADIYTAHRPSIDQPFGSPALVPELSSARDDVFPHISRDGSTMYLNYDTLTAGGGGQNADLFAATRPCL